MIQTQQPIETGYKPRLPQWLVWSFILIIALGVFSSCSTLKKIKSSEKITVDSSGVTKIDSNHTKTVDDVAVKKDNSVTVKETDGTVTTETVFEFADEPVGEDSATIANSILDWRWQPSADEPADYFPPIKTTGKLKKITVKTTGQLKTKETTTANTSDSARKVTTETTALKKDQATDVRRSQTIKNKEVKRTSYWGWLWIGIIAVVVFAAGWYFGWWLFIIAWWRTSNKDDYPITYTKNKKI